MSFVSSGVEAMFTSSSSNNRVSIGSYSAHDVYFWTGGGEEKMRMVDGGNLLVNPAQNTTNFQVYGDGEANLIYADATDNRVGIGEDFPGHDLEVVDADGDGMGEIQIGTAELIQDRGANHLGTNSDWEVDRHLMLNDAVEDNAGNTGMNAQVLSSTGGGVAWKDLNDLGESDGDWYYESADSSMLRNVGTEQDCVLVGTNGGGPTYPYHFAVDNGDATGTKIGIGSIEYLTDESAETTINNDFAPADDAIEDLGGSTNRWDRVYGIELFAADAVGINTTFPDSDLHIDKAGGDYAIEISNISDDASVHDGILLDNASNTWDIHMSYSWLRFAENGNNVAYVDPGNGSWNATSDRRLKEDISSSRSMLEDVLEIDVVSFNYKKNEGEMRQNNIGVIAQDAKELFPEFVSKDKGSGYYGVNYAGFSMVALKAIQEQQSIIEENRKVRKNLKEEVESLKKKNKELEERLKRIEEEIDIKDR
jgi:hypothetical protein